MTTNNQISFDKITNRLSVQGVVRLFLPKEKQIFEDILKEIRTGEISALDVDISNIAHVDLSMQFYLYKFAERLGVVENSSLKITANDNYRVQQLLVTNIHRFNPNTEFNFVEA